MAEIFQPVLVKFHILATKKKALATCIKTFRGGEGRGGGLVGGTLSPHYKDFFSFY
jgi:hypothetical protein